MIISHWKSFIRLQIKIGSKCCALPFQWNPKLQKVTTMEFPNPRFLCYIFGLTICFWRMVVMNILFYRCIQSNSVSTLGKSNCVFFANGAALLNLFNWYNFTKRFAIVNMLHSLLTQGILEGNAKIRCEFD